VILVAFGAHPDDVELGCGGTLVNAAAAGHHVLIVDLTRGERGSAGSGAIRTREARAAARILGVRRVTLDLPDTRLSRFDQRHERVVVRAIRAYRPDLVLAPGGSDRHPDHVEAHHLVRRGVVLAGFRRVAPALGAPHAARAVLYYPASRQLFAEPDLLVDIHGAIQQKLEALAAYRTQFVRRRGGPATPLNVPGFLDRVRARAAAQGIAAGLEHAEAFMIDRPIVARDPAPLFAGVSPVTGRQPRRGRR
jgi:N-acetylglucosamine malate deacetylase 1